MVPLRLVGGRGRRERAERARRSSATSCTATAGSGRTSGWRRRSSCCRTASAFPTRCRRCSSTAGWTGFSTQKLTWGSPVGIPFKVGNWEGPDGSSHRRRPRSGRVHRDGERGPQHEHELAGAHPEHGQACPGPTWTTTTTARATGAGRRARVERRLDREEHRGQGADQGRLHAGGRDVPVAHAEQKAKLPSLQGRAAADRALGGVVTSQAHMKRWNRKNELLADVAERASVAANLWAQTPYPQDRLYTAWDLSWARRCTTCCRARRCPRLTSSATTTTFSRLNGFAAVAKDSVGAVAARWTRGRRGRRWWSTTRFRSRGRTWWRRRCPPAEADRRRLRARRQARADAGPGGKGGPDEVLFLAKVPSTGFATYDARSFTRTETPRSTLSANRSHARKPALHASRINAAGDIASIYDKKNKRETLKSPARLDFQHHNPRSSRRGTWTGTTRRSRPTRRCDGAGEDPRGRERAGSRRPSRSSGWRRGRSSSSGSASRRAGRATGSRCANLIDWRTKESALKAAFPLTTANPKATYDLQAGAIERGVRDAGQVRVPAAPVVRPDRRGGQVRRGDPERGQVRLGQARRGHGPADPPLHAGRARRLPGPGGPGLRAARDDVRHRAPRGRLGGGGRALDREAAEPAPARLHDDRPPRVASARRCSLVSTDLARRSRCRR